MGSPCGDCWRIEIIWWYGKDQSTVRSTVLCFEERQCLCYQNIRKKKIKTKLWNHWWVYWGVNYFKTKLILTHVIPFVSVSVCYSYVFVCYLYALVCYSYVSVCYSYVFVCYLYVFMLLLCIRMLPVCIRMLLVCTRMLLVCISYVYSYVLVLLVCTPMLLVCIRTLLGCTRIYSYVTCMYSYVTRMYSYVQSNLDYPDSLGVDEIVRIIENMNVNEEQNCLNKATFNRETTLLRIAWKTIWSTVHFEPLNSEPIRTHSSVLH